MNAQLSLTVTIMVASIMHCHGYMPSSLMGSPYMGGGGGGANGDLLRDVVHRMTKDLRGRPSSAAAYLMTLPLGLRSLATANQGRMDGGAADEEQLFPLDYDNLGGGGMQPSLRDREFLEHSSLWDGQQNNHKPSGNILAHGVNHPHIPQHNEMKSDGTLPAYCNPPNPCPYGYTAAEHGCLEEFENTASFSRRYQASQDCMCDTEHMFDCPSLGAGSISSAEEDLVDQSMDGVEDETFNDLEFDRFIQRTMQTNSALHHKNLVAKKFHNKSYRENPFLVGEKLPVAAKKGNHVYY